MLVLRYLLSRNEKSKSGGLIEEGVKIFIGIFVLIGCIAGDLIAAWLCIAAFVYLGVWWGIMSILVAYVLEAVIYENFIK